MRIVLGEETERSREESFFEDKVAVVSRDGLNRSQRAIVPQLPRDKSGKALVINSDYAVLGLAMHALNPAMEILCHYDDAWDGDVARAMLAKHDNSIQLSVAADPPTGPWNYIIVPLSRRGIADLVRERVRLAATDWLAPQGLLMTSSDTKDDRFIRDEVKKAFGAMHTAPEDRRSGGVVYVARKPGKPLVAPPHSWASFTVREQDSVLTFHGRLGVFCHDRLDPGTRALLALMKVEGHRRILDLGCGSGIVGIVAALRYPESRVTFVDSYARSIESTQRNIAEHGIAERVDNILLSADAVKDLESVGKFDTVITNPPYYGNWRIAELFIKTAYEVLAPDGTLQLVTKAPQWYREQLAHGFNSITEQAKGGYMVLSAVRR